MPLTPQDGHTGPALVPSVVHQSIQRLLEDAVSATSCLPDADPELLTILRSWLLAVTLGKTRFELGTVVATPGALDSVPSQDMQFALGRHSVGDWGELDAHDWLANDDALAEGSRLVSAYWTRSGTPFWIITEWDRSVTTVLLPEEY